MRETDESSSGPLLLILLLGGGAVLFLGLLGLGGYLMFRSLDTIADIADEPGPPPPPGGNALRDTDGVLLEDKVIARNAAAGFLHQLSLQQPDVAYRDHTTAEFRQKHTEQHVRDLLVQRPQWGKKTTPLATQWNFQPSTPERIRVVGWTLGGGNIFFEMVREGGIWKVDQYRLE